ncbi:hypothetical protein L6R52_06265 [Myxococcota bacterium]|nr:hypothetical protein [Myxococcota bacterium]
MSDAIERLAMELVQEVRGLRHDMQEIRREEDAVGRELVSLLRGLQYDLRQTVRQGPAKAPRSKAPATRSEASIEEFLADLTRRGYP